MINTKLKALLIPASLSTLTLAMDAPQDNGGTLPSNQPITRHRRFTGNFISSVSVDTKVQIAMLSLAKQRRQNTIIQNGNGRNVIDMIARYMIQLKVQMWPRGTDEKLMETINKLSSEDQSKVFELDLGFCGSISHQGVAAVATKCPNISSLHLSGWGHITPERLLKIAQLFPNLKSLCLGMLETMTYETAVAFVRGCPNLVFLELTLCRHITNQHIDLLRKEFLPIRPTLEIMKVPTLCDR